ncbi:hypothetical protein HanRHA438_Chr14g0674471 [Helianthus annuus]|nr:hypothetical protein HanIR_Chr14g0719711 [Helianthus annuus]KAJ0855538.1 hypothetical protein HanRHA438_Chr14g0674471 [Helianthus annuus]
MNSTTMEHRIDTDYNNDDEDDTLSLRNLQMYDQTPTSSTRSSPRTSSAQDLFEFFPTLSNYTATRDIMFFGKLIPSSVHKGDNEELSNRVLGSTSFRLSERPNENAVYLRSVSNRDFGSPQRRMKLSMSKSKRRRFMFGPVKFMPEMDMSSIKERQARRMFAVAEGGADRRKAVEVTVREKNTTVSCRARLNSMFERSIACLRY